MRSAGVGFDAAMRQLARTVGRCSRGAGAAAWRSLAYWVGGFARLAWYPGFLAAPPTTHPLIQCARCSADCVSPVDWEEVGETHWWIRARCGACEVWRDVVVSDEEAESYDQALKRHAAVIERAVDRLDHERMRAEVEAFVGAVDHGLIDASWFMSV
jgi:hypothetical protein